jgi:hypothetical protein
VSAALQRPSQGLALRNSITVSVPIYGFFVSQLSRQAAGKAQKAEDMPTVRCLG